MTSTNALWTAPLAVVFAGAAFLNMLGFSADDASTVTSFSAVHNNPWD
jgi:hypothetical protein